MGMCRVQTERSNPRARAHTARARRQAISSGLMKRTVTVVTGASAGVGRAVAELAGARGDAVGLIARGSVGLDAAAKNIAAAGGTSFAAEADVANADEVESAASLVEGELGPIDVWVNDAFTSVFAPFDEITADEFRRITEVAYLGYVYGTKAALRRMRPRDAGVIVQVGSALAYRGIPLQSAYCGAKHAIQGFTESLRCELMHEGSAVRVTMVQLPAVNTPQFSWVLRGSHASRSRCRRSISPKWPRAPCCMPPGTIAANGGSARAPRRRSSRTRSSPVYSTAISHAPVSTASRPTNRHRTTGPRTSGTRPTRPRTSARTASSTTARTARSPQWWATTHRRALLVSSATAAGLLGWWKRSR